MEVSMAPALKGGDIRLKRFKEFNGPGPCLFLAEARATSASTSSLP